MPISMFSITAEESERSPDRLCFTVSTEGLKETFALELGDPNGFGVRHIDGALLLLKIGGIAMGLSAYPSEYPPLVKFVDMLELDGDLVPTKNFMRDGNCQINLPDRLEEEVSRLRF